MGLILICYKNEDALTFLIYKNGHILIPALLFLMLSDQMWLLVTQKSIAKYDSKLQKLEEKWLKIKKKVLSEMDPIMKQDLLSLVKNQMQEEQGPSIWKLINEDDKWQIKTEYLNKLDKLSFDLKRLTSFEWCQDWYKHSRHDEERTKCQHHCVKKFIKLNRIIKKEAQNY